LGVGYKWEAAPDMHDDPNRLEWLRLLPVAEEPPETKIRQYAERFKILREIDQAILGARSPEAIAVGALNGIRPLIPYGRGSVVTFDVAGACLVLAVVASPDFAGE